MHTAIAQFHGWIIDPEYPERGECQWQKALEGLAIALCSFSVQCAGTHLWQDRQKEKSKYPQTNQQGVGPSLNSLRPGCNAQTG